MIFFLSKQSKQRLILKLTLVLNCSWGTTLSLLITKFFSKYSTWPAFVRNVVISEQFKLLVLNKPICFFSWLQKKYKPFILIEKLHDTIFCQKWNKQINESQQHFFKYQRFRDRMKERDLCICILDKMVEPNKFCVIIAESI